MESHSQGGISSWKLTPPSSFKHSHASIHMQVLIYKHSYSRTHMQALLKTLHTHTHTSFYLTSSSYASSHNTFLIHTSRWNPRVMFQPSHILTTLLFSIPCIFSTTTSPPLYHHFTTFKTCPFYLISTFTISYRHAYCFMMDSCTYLIFTPP